MIEFLQDFRGKLTKERYYTKGTVVDLDGSTETALVNDGRAKFVGGVLQDSAPEMGTPSTVVTEAKKRGRPAKAK